MEKIHRIEYPGATDRPSCNKCHKLINDDTLYYSYIEGYGETVVCCDCYDDIMSTAQKIFDEKQSKIKPFEGDILDFIRSRMNFKE